MQTRLARIFVLLAAVQILGGHWAVLQSVAWVKMVVDYAQSDSLAIAIGKTFDGAHPCDLCLLVKHEQSEQKKHETLPLAKKVDAVLVREDTRTIYFTPLFEFPMVRQQAVAWNAPPPVPPPRA